MRGAPRSYVIRVTFLRISGPVHDVVTKGPRSRDPARTFLWTVRPQSGGVLVCETNPPTEILAAREAGANAKVVEGVGSGVRTACPSGRQPAVAMPWRRLGRRIETHWRNHDHRHHCCTHPARTGIARPDRRRHRR